MVKSRFSKLLAVILIFCNVALAQAVAPAPPTPKRPVTSEYHGVKVTEDYRWLENMNDPEVRNWVESQNLRTRNYLDRLPSRPALKKRFEELILASSPAYFDLQIRDGLIFARKFQPPKEQPLLVTLKSANDVKSEEVLLDPNVLGDKGSLSIDFYTPSLDGKLVAVALSERGSEDSTAHVYEAATGKELADKVPRVNYPTAGGSIAWNADGSGFYYTRYPQGNERPQEDMNFYQQVFFHKIGSDSQRDSYVIGRDFPRIAEIILDTRGKGDYLLVSVANGDGGEFAHYIMDPTGKWTQVTRFADEVISAAIGPDHALYMLSRQNAPHGMILRVPVSDPQLGKAKTVVPESADVIEDYGTGARASNLTLVPTDNRLYVLSLAGGPERVRVFDHNGRQMAVLQTPAISSVSELVQIQGDDVLFNAETYLTPSAWYYFDAKASKADRTALLVTSPATFDDAEVVREFAISNDGTKVPMNIVRRKGTALDGQNPVLLAGYGGYGVSETPGFLGASGRVWLDAGGVYVLSNIRGGGEFGEEWHSAGKLTKKQNVFDDFYACAKHLLEAKYTNPARLAIIGGSNGGLLMGAELTQHPEMFRAVVSSVGIYDMLRVELEPNGAFNTTEFGSVKDPAQFQALYAYSPYHNVKDGTGYPAVLFLTGDNDGRVNPANSRKMTARLQAATSSKYPILLRTTSKAGHGIGTALSERIEQASDRYSFLFDQLGMEFKAGSRPASAIADQQHEH